MSRFQIPKLADRISGFLPIDLPQGDQGVDIKKKRKIAWIKIFPYSSSDGNPDARRLYDDLISRYNKLVRPVMNVTDPLTVHIKLKLSQLIEVVSKIL
ncbi:nicotinic acetylcholine receptor alpha subunit [Caerostris darwini]|uniref:Nicotinic acetylcholine receptor alpha subunit n=1 Tax=Caerostris darwini TaxID=1538125 RepID=A0AAV4WW16_9ARAC|nr:nicotinic acetylcholine receptor alpha subunit [Caerostris darwini]